MANGEEVRRYFDKGSYLEQFASRVFSVCPKCSGVALITSRWPCRDQTTHRRLTCLQCSFQLRPSEAKWLGPVDGSAKARCKQCGVKWLKHTVHEEALRGDRSGSVLLTCHSCGYVQDVALRFSRPVFGTAVDPVFGLPLWLQISCCGETLWAFNGEHVATLRAYIGATLRERTVCTRGMIYKLPNWMKIAKHRENVLSSLDRLQEKAESLKQG